MPDDARKSRVKLPSACGRALHPLHAYQQYVGGATGTRLDRRWRVVHPRASLRSCVARGGPHAGFPRAPFRAAPLGPAPNGTPRSARTGKEVWAVLRATYRGITIDEIQDWSAAPLLCGVRHLCCVR